MEKGESITTLKAKHINVHIIWVPLEEKGTFHAKYPLAHIMLVLLYDAHYTNIILMSPGIYLLCNIVKYGHSKRVYIISWFIFWRIIKVAFFNVHLLILYFPYLYIYKIHQHDHKAWHSPMYSHHCRLYPPMTLKR